MPGASRAGVRRTSGNTRRNCLHPSHRIGGARRFLSATASDSQVRESLHDFETAHWDHEPLSVVAAPVKARPSPDLGEMAAASQRQLQRGGPWEASTISEPRIGAKNRKRQQAGRTPNASRSSETLSMARKRLECAELAPAFSAGSWRVSTISRSRIAAMNPPLTPPRWGSAVARPLFCSPPGRGWGWVASWKGLVFERCPLSPNHLPLLNVPPRSRKAARCIICWPDSVIERAAAK